MPNKTCRGWRRQTAIAETLNNMDAEITALERKLVKAGMMSEGGRVRLA
jgi:hypothetical protein